MKTKYDHTFEDAAAAAGAQVRCLWQLAGPKDTMISGMECLSVNGIPVIIQTYHEGGWEVFTAGRSNRVDETITDALTRCGVKIAA